MANLTITFQVDDSERAELVARAAREKVNLSDYIRVRLGLRAQGSPGDADIRVDDPHERIMREQLADHELRLQTLEAAWLSARARA
jgi:hypothetical protein